MPPPATFQDLVDAAVSSVPSGRVTTYGDVAKFLGLPNHSRHVGYAMRTCGAGVPWWRCLGGNGRISLKGESANLQRQNLQEEGVEFASPGHEGGSAGVVSAKQIRNFGGVRWAFGSAGPPEKKAEQGKQKSGVPVRKMGTKQSQNTAK